VQPAQSTDSVAGFDQGAQLRNLVTSGTKHLLLGQEARRLAGFASGHLVLGIGQTRGLAVFDATVLGHLLLAVEKNDAILVGTHLKPPAK
jgi:hypothetical protein